MSTSTLPLSSAGPIAAPTLSSGHKPALGSSRLGAKRRIRLLVADDHPVVRKGLNSCLQGRPNLEIVGEAAEGQETLRKARELTPDVLLVDVDMPNLTGLQVAELLRKELPRTKVLIISSHTSTEYLMRILKSGARGYVQKEAAPEELVEAIETVAAGDTFFSPQVARLAINQFVRPNGEASRGPPLSDREREVLVLIADGLSNKEIACRLNIGTRTVETHRERMMRKLDIHSIAGLTKFAITKGLVALPGLAAR